MAGFNQRSCWVDESTSVELLQCSPLLLTRWDIFVNTLNFGMLRQKKAKIWPAIQGALALVRLVFLGVIPAWGPKPSPSEIYVRYGVFERIENQALSFDFGKAFHLSSLARRGAWTTDIEEYPHSEKIWDLPGHIFMNWWSLLWPELSSEHWAHQLVSLSLLDMSARNTCRICP